MDFKKIYIYWHAIWQMFFFYTREFIQFVMACYNKMYKNDLVSSGIVYCSVEF